MKRPAFTLSPFLLVIPFILFINVKLAVNAFIVLYVS